MVSLWWLRRDFRLSDNKTLFKAVKSGEKIQPIFIFDENILQRFSKADDERVRFIKQSLRFLNQQLIKYNTKILIFSGKPEEILPKLITLFQVKKIFAGKDHEEYGIKRDNLIAKYVALEGDYDHVIIAPDKIYKEGGDIYRVFTPYYRHWQQMLGPLNYHDYSINLDQVFYQTNLIEEQIKANGFNLVELDFEQLKYFRPEDVEQNFNSFLQSKLDSYSVKRDFLDTDGTSGVSPYLRFGNISIRQCYRSAISFTNDTKWISELCWREFYVMILYNLPEIATHEMQIKFRKIIWSDDQNTIKRVYNGETGYPVVDAAIRQLTSTGWMHNRARMIVASFFCKNLWLDWRIGEEFFAQYLMDYEASSNIGNWQWTASVATDAQPYFRIFNPELQSQKFDPKGAYVKKFIPELKLANVEKLYSSENSVSGYPSQIVDYKFSRERALANFKKFDSLNI